MQVGKWFAMLRLRSADATTTADQRTVEGQAEEKADLHITMGEKSIAAKIANKWFYLLCTIIVLLCLGLGAATALGIIVALLIYFI